MYNLQECHTSFTEATLVCAIHCPQSCGGLHYSECTEFTFKPFIGLDGMSLHSFLILDTPDSTSSTQASTVLEQSHTEQCKYITYYHIIAFIMAAP